jgi:hypothetical protein
LLLRQLESATEAEDIVLAAAGLTHNDYVSSDRVVDAMLRHRISNFDIESELWEMIEYLQVLKIKLRERGGLDVDEAQGPAVHPASANDLPGLWPGTSMRY